MYTTEESPKIRRVPTDKWSIREQLCLAEAVVRSGDQKWMTVSRLIKSLTESSRPSDWFSPKNCAVQYEFLLGKYSSEPGTAEETPAEIIARVLKQERKIELQNLINEEKTEYLQLQKNMELIRSGAATDSVIEGFLVQIKEQEKQKQQGAVTNEQCLIQRKEQNMKGDIEPITQDVEWLKQRKNQKLEEHVAPNTQQDAVGLKQSEEQKLEVAEPNTLVLGQKRKAEVNKEEECPAVKQISLDESLLESSGINQIVEIIESDIIIIENTEIEKNKKCDDTAEKEEVICAPETKTVETKQDTVPEAVDNVNNNNSEVTDLIITDYNSDHLIPVKISLMGEDIEIGLYEIMKFMIMADADDDKEVNKKVSSTTPKEKPVTTADKPKSDASKFMMKDEDDDKEVNKKVSASIKTTPKEKTADKPKSDVSKSNLAEAEKSKQDIQNSKKMLPKPRTVEKDVQDYTTWKKHSMLTYNRIAAHEFAYVFLKPITGDIVPRQHKLIYQPMDLQTIRKKIESGVIRTAEDFQSDLMLMFTNAIMNTKTNGTKYKMARKMQVDAIKEIQNLRKILAENQ